MERDDTTAANLQLNGMINLELTPRKIVNVGQRCRGMDAAMSGLHKVKQARGDRIRDTSVSPSPRSGQG